MKIGNLIGLKTIGVFSGKCGQRVRGGEAVLWNAARHDQYAGMYLAPFGKREGEIDEVIAVLRYEATAIATGQQQLIFVGESIVSNGMGANGVDPETLDNDSNFVGEVFIQVEFQRHDGRVKGYFSQTCSIVQAFSRSIRSSISSGYAA
jgi:hypothetical protein